MRKLKRRNHLIELHNTLTKHPLASPPRERFVDNPTRPHAFIPSRTVGECAGCIYPEKHEIHSLQACNYDESLERAIRAIMDLYAHDHSPSDTMAKLGDVISKEARRALEKRKG